MTSDIKDGRRASVMQQASHLGAHAKCTCQGQPLKPLENTDEEK